jgi:hypothetical protein
MATKPRIVKIGTHRGNSRLWLEGQWLRAAGFVKGDRFSLELTSSSVHLIADPTGDRTISGKKDGAISIIDVNCKEINAVLPGGSARVQVGTAGDRAVIVVTAETAAVQLARHRAEDPHCTCNDCILEHFATSDDAATVAQMREAGMSEEEIRGEFKDASYHGTFGDQS